MQTKTQNFNDVYNRIKASVMNRDADKPVPSKCNLCGGLQWMPAIKTLEGNVYTGLHRGYGAADKGTIAYEQRRHEQRDAICNAAEQARKEAQGQDAKHAATKRMYEALKNFEQQPGAVVSNWNVRCDRCWPGQIDEHINACRLHSRGALATPELARSIRLHPMIRKAIEDKIWEQANDGGNILISGPTGSGKTLLTKIIYNHLVRLKTGDASLFWIDGFEFVRRILEPGLLDSMKLHNIFLDDFAAIERVDSIMGSAWNAPNAEAVFKGLLNHLYEAPEWSVNVLNTGRKPHEIDPRKDMVRRVDESFNIKIDLWGAETE